MIEVDAIGSTFFNARKKAIIINIEEIIKVIFIPKAIGKVMSPEAESPLKSGNVVNNATEEKHNAYGIKENNIDASNGIKKSE